MEQVHSYWKYYSVLFFFSSVGERGIVWSWKKKPLDLTVLRFESRVLELVLGFREFHQGHSSKSTEV